MAVWICFLSAAPTAQNSTEMNIRFIDSYIRGSTQIKTMSLKKFFCAPIPPYFWTFHRPL